ncbi:MAG: NADH-quinone oxidoreductase subunit L [Actinomycetota bacterium]
MDARDLLQLAWLIPMFPAIGAVVLLAFGKRVRGPTAGWIATAMIALSFVASIVTFGALISLDEHERAVVSDGFTWLETGGFVVDFRFLVDPLSAVMILFVTGVGTLIHLYSIGYMHGDERFGRFFAYMNLFATSIIVLVLGSNFLVTFLGWEGVGLCSYLLISFWFERNSAAVAGKKAFVTNRVGDVGFMLAMFMIFQNFRSLDYAGEHSVLLELPEGFSNTTATAIALLLFLGAMGKSAQVPLHVWLPDAMEGPTPVSALIHAATMVTAGVFLVCRANAFFEFSDDAGTIVAWVGAVTALFAATVAIVQWDIKRVLAYSTISQLGYMFLAAGVGAYSAAMFHMITHAFFKALLFMAAGSVIHGLNGQQDMRWMGALRRWMPVTAGTFIVGWLSIAGIVPFSGLWSKDEILASAWAREEYALWAVGAVGALFTAFYMTRLVYLVFYGNERWRDAPTADHAHEPHESPATMTFPLMALAALATIGGLINLPFVKEELDFLARWLHPVFEAASEVHLESFSLGFTLSTIAVVVAVVGIVVGRALYQNGLQETDPAEAKLGPLAKVLASAYYLDVGIARFVSGPATLFARVLAEGIDRRIVDGAVNGIGGVFRSAGGGLRRVQTGLVRSYALAIILGTVALLGYVWTRAL